MFPVTFVTSVRNERAPGARKTSASACIDTPSVSIIAARTGTLHYSRALAKNPGAFPAARARARSRGSTGIDDVTEIERAPMKDEEECSESHPANLVNRLRDLNNRPLPVI